MWKTLPAAFIALLTLSDLVSARRHRRSIDACTPSASLPNAGSESFLERHDGVATAPPALFLTTFSAVPMAAPTALPENAFTTFTVVPMPIGTVDGHIYSGIPQKPETFAARPTGPGIPAGIFFPGAPSGTGVPSGAVWTGYGSGTGTGSSGPRPTALIEQNSTSGRTHHRPAANRPSKPSSTSIPFFTLLEPAPSTSIPLPSNVVIPSSTSSTSTTSTALSTVALATVEAVPTPLPKPIKAIPSAPAPAPPPPPPPPASTPTPFLRGVNLGGWLVLEKWMNPSAFTGPFSTATDEYTFSSLPNAASALTTHWSTFITEADIQTIAATGINALRIPIGFWAYDNANTPYIKGADAYMEKAIGWARDAGMKVWVDCHGSPGSQNGFDNSGQAGAVDWQTTANLERSIAVLKIMAKKYGALKYADVVVGLQLTNEPISYGNNDFHVTQKWAQDAYAAVKSQVQNEELVIVMHDAFQGAQAWTDVAQALSSKPHSRPNNPFGVDTHLYQLFDDRSNTLTQAQHITTACGWEDSLSSANAIMPTYVGEFSAATNICVNPDGSTTAGTSCSTSGCQCQSTPFDQWNPQMVEQVRRFVEAQLDVFESSSSGYFMWSAKGPGGWGFLNGIENGAIPNPVTSRKYPGQCGGGKARRSGRASMRIEGDAVEVVR